MESLQHRGLNEFNGLIESLQESDSKNNSSSKIDCSKIEDRVMQIIENYKLLGVNELNVVLQRLDSVFAQKLEHMSQNFKIFSLFSSSRHEEKSLSHLHDVVVLIQETNAKLIEAESSNMQDLSKFLRVIFDKNPVLASKMFTLLPNSEEKGKIRQIWEIAGSNHLISIIEKQMQILQNIPLHKEKQRLEAMHDLDKSLSNLFMQLSGTTDENVRMQIFHALVDIESNLQHQILTLPTGSLSVKNQLGQLVSMHEKVYHVAKLLILIPQLPRSVDLKDPSSAEILEPFVNSLSKLIELDKNFAYTFARQLGENTKNALLFNIVSDYHEIDFSTYSLHVDVLQLLLGLHPQIHDVKYKSLEEFEGKLDLSRASVEGTQAILLREGNKIKSLTLSGAFILSEGVVNLLVRDDSSDDFLKPLFPMKPQQKWEECFLKGDLHALQGVQELHITPLVEDKPMELKGQQLHVLSHLFPEVRLASLPSICLKDSEFLANTKDNIFMNEEKELKTIKKQLMKLSPQFRLSLMRSLCEGGSLTSPLYWSLFQHFGRKNDFLTSDYLLQQVLSSKDHQPIKLISHPLVNDWMSLGHQLLSLGLLDQVILSHKTYLDFSEQPLLTDKDLLTFLNNKEPKGETNLQKVDSLHLRHCPEITSKAVEEILGQVGELKELNLSGNPQINDDTFLNLPVKVMPYILTISLRGTSVTERGIEVIKRRYPGAYIIWDARGQNGSELRKETGSLLLDVGGKKISVHPELIARQDRHFAEKCLMAGIPEQLKFEGQLSEASLQVLKDYLYEGHVSKLDEKSAWELLDFLKKERFLPHLLYHVGSYLSHSTTPENVLERIEHRPGKRIWIHYLATCCYPGSVAFKNMSKEQQSQVHGILLSEKYPVISGEGFLYEQDIFPKEFPNCFEEEILIKGLSGDHVEILLPVNLLRLQSSELCEVLGKKPSEITSSNPKILAQVLEACKRNEAFDFKDGKMSLSEGVSFLEEASRWGLVESRALDLGLLCWWVQYRLVASPDHPDWNRLVKWVSSHVPNGGNTGRYDRELILDVIKRRREGY